MTPEQLIAAALEAPADSAECILYAAAAFDALTSDSMVLVGGGAQVTHTGVGRLTDIDLVGVVTPEDHERLARHGFRREGRHWVMESAGRSIAVEVPSDALLGEEEPEATDIGVAIVRVISVNDLMMDRLVQATDGTEVTWDEALALAIAAFDRIDWEKLSDRADAVASADPFLGNITELLNRLLESAQ